MQRQDAEAAELEEEGAAPYIYNKKTGILHAAQVGSKRHDTRHVIIAHGASVEHALRLRADQTIYQGHMGSTRPSNAVQEKGMCHGLGRANRPGLTRAIRQEHDAHRRVNEWIDHTTLDPQEVWNGAGLRDPRSQMCKMKGDKELNSDEAEASQQAFNGE